MDGSRRERQALSRPPFFDHLLRRSISGAMAFKAHPKNARRPVRPSGIAGWAFAGDSLT